MKSQRNRWLGLGFLAGAAVGLVWTWRRAQEIALHGPPGLVDWERVCSTAGRFTRGTFVPAGAQGYFRNLVDRSIYEVGAATGLRLPSATLSLRVLNRQEWLEANIHNFQELLRPVDELYRRAASPRNPVTVFLGEPIETFISAQLGMLLGYLSQRVLGQYDIALLGREPLRDGQLYFVEPNIRGLQQQLGLSGGDFPMWVALHETTHAFEFEAHPWLRGHFNRLLQDYLAELEPEVDRLSRTLGPAGIAELFEQMRRGGSWLLWALSPRQREIFDQMQALMCIVEGYSNLVMKQVGRRILPTFDLIEARIAQRQAERPAVERFFARLTGLDLKMEQYRLGERFAEAVVRARGHDFLLRVWERAENLPTLAEIEHPQRWIARMEGKHA